MAEPLYSTRVAPSGTTVLRPTGRLNLTTAPSLRSQLHGLIAAGHTNVVVDLADTEAVDSSGIGALISSLKAARAAGGDLRITAPNDQVRRVLKLTNLGLVLVVHTDPDDPFDDLDPPCPT
jgi:anti-anti-sigma factor